MHPPGPSTIVRTVLRVAPAPRSASARALGAVALLGALAATGRRLWLRRAAGRFAAVRGPRFAGPPVALLETPAPAPGEGPQDDPPTGPGASA